MKKNLLALSLITLGLCASAQTPRLSLYEEFTGETCPPCAATNPGLNVKLAASFSKIAAIKWQVPIPSAPSNTWSLYQTDKTEIDWRWRTGAAYYSYNPAINSAPSSKIDGQEATIFGAASGHPANLNSTVINTAQSYTSAFSITMARAWDATGSAVNLTISIQATAPFTAVGPLIFRTVMVERLIQFSVQPGTNGERTFEDAARKCFPTLQGGVAMASTWTIGQTQTFTLNCSIPSYVRDKAQIAFVGFIQDDGNQKVAQAVRADKQAVPDDAVAVSAVVPITCNTSIAPMVTVLNNGLNVITAMTITPSSDAVAGPVTTWAGNLAPSASTTIPLNPMTVSGSAGSHVFSYNISAINAVDFNTSNNTTKVNYVLANNYQSTPVAEGFTGAAYPPSGFTVINPDAGTASWSKMNGCGGYNLSGESTKYDFFNNTVIGDKDELVLPPVDLSGAADPDMFFDVAYAQRDATSSDALEVFASSDCGATWTSVYSKQGAALQTCASCINAVIATSYVPDTSTPGDWRTEQITLPGFNKSNVLVKFVTTSDNGNNLYLDNINLSQSNPTGIKKIADSQMNVSIYPNPTNGITNINITAKKASDATVSVMNMLGQVVTVKQVSLTLGANSVQLDMKEYATGVYNVTINTANGSVVKKLNVTK